MSLEQLNETIARHGFAHVLVYLDRNRSTVSERRIDYKSIRVRRTHQVYRPEVLDELASAFSAGWQDLGNSLNEDNLDPALVTPTIRQLLQLESAYRGKSHMQHFPRLGIVYGAITAAGLEKIMRHAAVDEIHLSVNSLAKIQPLEAQSLESSGTQYSWGLTRLGIPDLWNMGFKGKDVVIAHLDTGIDSTHAAFANGFLEEKAIFDTDGHLETSPITIYADTDWHGTHTAGTLVSSSVAGHPVSGVAPEARLVSATVIDAGNAPARVLSGLEWALGTGAKVLNLSVAFPGWDGSFEKAIKDLRNQQMLPVIASGNFPNMSCSPGNYDSAFSVGAVGITDVLSSISSSQQPGQQGVGPKLSAPGVAIQSTMPGGGFASKTGTSMAAPHVAGLAALLIQARPNATIDQIQEAIIRSCTNPAAQPVTRIGAGIPYGPDALTELDDLLAP